MTKLNEIYKCSVCGNIVEVVHASVGELTCCGKPMVLQTENTVDAAKEKHVPFVTKTADGYKVQIGSVEHPMTEEHHIEWIELICEECNKVMRKHLNPGDKPVAEFKTKSQKVLAREYCNLHGLWSTKEVQK
ncbi:Superoxide reductase Sor [Elusimicrobium minutum Pei191]|uniref:Desulfoferrodoxin n=1 Tax=Elusimicrobium minutum (strain Pei191) TaxID=445932 RepID=B2KAN3_ELUMP|nr:desulfoferrodoxin [Elusimicrobium minutum]ACC97579.1 Superoxide reductase Sor [Elusimicrobium minutum Pei191]